MSVSESDVNAWFAANPGATQNDVAAAVQSIGGLEANPGLAGMLANVYQSTPENVSNYYNNYTGVAPNTPTSVDPLYQIVAPVADYGKIPRSVYTSSEESKSSQAVQANRSAPAPVSRTDVNAWFAANPNATEYDIAKVVQSIGGLAANPGLDVLLAEKLQSTPQNISNYYNNYTKDVSNTQAAVDKFFAENPKATASDAAKAVASIGGINALPGLAEALAKKYSNTPQQITDAYTNYITQKVAPPTFNDVYQPWLSSYQQQFGTDINRPWNADQDSANVKASLDKQYIDKINQYNKQYGTNLKPDASVLGVNAQPNSFTVQPTGSGPGFFGWVGDTVHHVGTTIAQSPILNAAAVGALTYFGVPPSVAAGIVSANAGAKPETIALNMLAAGIAPEIVKQVAPQISSLTGSNLAGQVVGQAAGNATGAVITGRDPLKAGLASLVSGGANVAAGELATEIPGWSEMGPLQQKAVISTMSATMQGKSPTTALVQSALNAGKQVASDYAKQAVGNTRMGLTNGFEIGDDLITFDYPADSITSLIDDTDYTGGTGGNTASTSNTGEVGASGNTTVDPFYEYINQIVTNSPGDEPIDDLSKSGVIMPDGSYKTWAELDEMAGVEPGTIYTDGGTTITPEDFAAILNGTYTGRAGAGGSGGKTGGSGTTPSTTTTPKTTTTTPRTTTTTSQTTTTPKTTSTTNVIQTILQNLPKTQTQNMDLLSLLALLAGGGSQAAPTVVSPDVSEIRLMEDIFGTELSAPTPATRKYYGGGDVDSLLKLIRS